MRSPLIVLLITAALSLSSGVARAQVNPKIRSAARALGAEGLKLFDEGKYEEALDKFERADELLPAPTLGIRAARCLVKLGRYVEAAERYLEVTRHTLEYGAPSSHRTAVRDAKSEREELLPKIAQLEIRVAGPRGDGIQVSVDGEELPAALVDVSSPFDPGDHKVVARRGEVEVVERVTLDEGERATVTLTLPELGESAAEDPHALSLWQNVALTSGGVGVGALTLAGMNGIAALALRSQLKARCPDSNCPPSAHARVDRYDAARAITTVSLIVGAVGVAAGAALWFSADAIEGGESEIEVGVGPGAIGVRLRF